MMMIMMTIIQISIEEKDIVIGILGIGLHLEMLVKLVIIQELMLNKKKERSSQMRKS
jgi:hypothetical protein